MNNYLLKKGSKGYLFKRCLTFILSGAVAIPFSVSESFTQPKTVIHGATNEVTYGDVNSDGNINIVDMIKI